MLAYAVVSAAIFAILESKRTHKYVLFFLSAFLFGFLHFLSVRTGLALTYIGLGLTLIWYVITNKNYLLGLGVAAFLVAIPFIAFKTIEPFKRKINYMFWDLAQYQQGKGNNYSDSERIMSYQISLLLIKESPIVGHGVGDLRPLMIEKHKNMYGQKDKYIYPHNQYLYVLTCIGVLGGLVFFFGLLSPLIYIEQRNVFIVSIFALMLISFLVENTIQRAIITGFFLFFILLNLSLNSRKCHETLPIQ
jgi:O-antigen ligase